MAETSRALRAEARRLTAARGLHGFTIEEVCSEAGVSRRTFFNYFASKEHAVVGVPVRTDDSDLVEAFLAGGPTGDLVDDLAELMVARWERMDTDRSEAHEIARAFEREPQLVTHVIDWTLQGQREDIELTERRTGVAPGDLRAAALVHVLEALMRPTITEYFFEESEADFRTLYRRRLAAARDALRP
ncbi:TetR family transcriptional regulator [Agromyces mangrovi Wang et al. 2018]|nr:TetR family transcriptional regulator [Agromyces mangrovi]